MTRITSGQTSLILILLAAAALIFFAISLNWGRIAQIKAMATIAANQGAAVMGSSLASDGEMQWKTHDEYFHGKLKECESTGFFLYILELIVAIVVVILSGGSAWYILALAIASLVMAIASLVLQLAVIQPGITSLWNKLQKDQPMVSQFLEQGISAPFQSTVTDNVMLTDYFDMNVNGRFGLDASGRPKDFINRFGFFYTERLKALQIPSVDQIKDFTAGLSGLLQGPMVTCADHPAAACCQASPAPKTCQDTSQFHLDDRCTTADPTQAGYKPFCDPCCVPLYSGKMIPNPNFGRGMRGGCPSGADCQSPQIPQRLRPDNCYPLSSSSQGQDVPPQCLTNNPYAPSYPYLYNPAYQQDYAHGQSFLEKFGRDAPMRPFSIEKSMGIFPFFWKMADWSPRVDAIDASTVTSSSPDCHWCSAQTTSSGLNCQTSLGGEFSDLSQLTLTRACHGNACCVNRFGNSVSDPVSVDTKLFMDKVTPLTLLTAGECAIKDGAPAPARGFGCLVAQDNVCAANQDASTGFWWKKGDDRMCASINPATGKYTWPYDINCPKHGNGTCTKDGHVAPCPCQPASASQWPEDNLDGMVNVLSDFILWAGTLEKKSFGELNKTFLQWYPQAAEWIAPKCGCVTAAECKAKSSGPYDFAHNLDVCNPGTEGHLVPVKDMLKQWQGLMDQWLNENYADANAWCVPPADDPRLSTDEKNYINGRSVSGPDGWGDLGHVVACLDYNKTNDQKFQDCLTALTPAVGQACPASLPTACQNLPRSLVAGTAPLFSGSCDVGGGYKKWVNDSYQLAINQSAKFKKRYAFLNDVYTKAQTMDSSFTDGYNDLEKFLAPCPSSSIGCLGDGIAGHPQPGAAAQLMYGRSIYQSALDELPNFVIYGWRDKDKPKGTDRDSGYWHLVKIRAYSPGRCPGGQCLVNNAPWIHTYTDLTFGWMGLDMDRCFEMADYTGNVLVSVTRWDEDRDPIVNFANKIPLWRFVFHKPGTPNIGKCASCAGGDTTGGGPIYSTIANRCVKPGAGFGYGLTTKTLNALLDLEKPSALDLPNQRKSKDDDRDALKGAFMLNSIPKPKKPGDIDLTKVSDSTAADEACCLDAVNTLLGRGMESRSCAQYSASEANGGHFTLQFVKCPDFPADEAQAVTCPGVAR